MEVNIEKFSVDKNIINSDEELAFEDKSISLRERLFAIIRHLFLIIISVIMFFPFVWMLFSALKSKENILKFPLSFSISNLQWNNLIDVFKEAPFHLYIFNSFFVSFITVSFQLISIAMISYALTQFRFRGRKILFVIIMITYMLPSAVTYVPCYNLLVKMKLIDTLTGLIVSNLANVFGIFLIRQSFMQIDKSLIEAARIDGASHFRIILKIMIPLTKPTFVTFALISFITNYNQYMYPSLIIKSPEKFLISAGIRQFFIEGGAYGMNWSAIMAASTITVLPLLIIFFVCQKWFMQVVNDGGIKQ